MKIQNKVDTAIGFKTLILDLDADAGAVGLNGYLEIPHEFVDVDVFIHYPDYVGGRVEKLTPEYYKDEADKVWVILDDNESEVDNMKVELKQDFMRISLDVIGGKYAGYNIEIILAKKQ